MSALGDYLSKADLERKLEEFAAATNARFSVRLNGSDDSYAGEPIDPGATGAVSVPLELDGNRVATLYAVSDSGEKEHTAGILRLLQSALEEKVATEREFENLSMEIAGNYEEISQVLENNNLFADALDLYRISQVTLERARVLTGSTVASIMLYDAATGMLKRYDHVGGPAVEGAVPDDPDAPAVPEHPAQGETVPETAVKGSLWEPVVSNLQPVLIEDVNNAEELDPAVRTALDFDIFARSCFLSVPLKVKEEAIGVLNVGDRSEGTYNALHVKLLSSLASQSASSIEKSRLYHEIEEEAKIRANFQRYLSPAIVDDIIKSRKDLTLGGEVAEVSVLFSDICGFTAVSERERPEVIVYLLNEYFSVMTEIIFRHNGTLDKFIGDAIMAVFGAPIFSPSAHRDAVAAALEMQQALGRLIYKWEGEGFPTFQQRVGINTGQVIAGNIGSPDRMDYTVIGDVVNLASRMESNARPMTTLISENTYLKVMDHVKVNRLEPIKVKGKAEMVQTYEVMAVKSDQQRDSVRRFARYEVAIALTMLGGEGTPRKLNGTVLNISPGGALLAMSEELVIGSVLVMNFVLDDTGREISISGEVVYEKKLKDTIGIVYYHTGVEFDESKKIYERELMTFISS